MILILFTELAQAAFSGYALWYTWCRWRVAHRRRKDYQAAKKNGMTGLANRLRETREWDRTKYQANFFICLVLFLSWRLANLDRSVPVIASMVFHYPFIYGSAWAFNQTRKDLNSEDELREMTEHEEHALATRIAITDALQAGLVTANTKLDDIKEQATKDRES